MKVKIGTSIDGELLTRLQGAAHRKGKHLNEVLEEAIERYLARTESREDDIVARTWGTYNVERRTLDRLMNEDIYES